MTSSPTSNSSLLLLQVAEQQQQRRRTEERDVGERKQVRQINKIFTRIMASRDRGTLKKHLYDLFKRKIDTDIIDMVFAGCNYQVEDAIEALSGMCVSPEKAKTQDAGTHVPTEESSALPVSGALPCYKASLKPKTLVLMRGLPGSGKTFLANQLKQENDVILSTDDYFKVGSRFNFNGEALQEAHDWNLARARAAMRRIDVDRVFIDNTNTRCWEMKPYVIAAKKLGYEVEVMIPETPWAWNSLELAKRNHHGVPRGTIVKMLGRFERNVTVADIWASQKHEGPHTHSRRNDLQTDLTDNDHTRIKHASSVDDNSKFTPSTEKSPKLRKIDGLIQESLITAMKKELSENNEERSDKSGTATLSRRPVELAEEVVCDGAQVIRHVDDYRSRVDSGNSIIDENFDNELDSAFSGPSKVREVCKDDICSAVNKEVTSLNTEDLKFLLECFPDYESDVLESVYRRFDGDLMRVCSEIMEQPLVKMTTIDRLQSITDNSENDLMDNTSAAKSRPFDSEMDEVDTVKDDTAYAYVRQTDYMKTANERNFMISIDGNFVASMKRKRGQSSEIQDDFTAEELEFPVDEHFAEEIYSQWLQHYKMKRKRLGQQNNRGKSKKTTKRDEAPPVQYSISTSNTYLALNHSLQEPDYENIPTTSRLTEISSQDGGKSKLKGTFRPWATKSGPSIDMRLQEPLEPKWDIEQESSENRLYTMFPTVQTDVLDEIYNAMNYNIDAAIEAVKTSLMIASKETTSVDERESREASPHQNKKEKKKPTPVTKKKDSGKAREKSPVINKNDPAKARDVSPVANKKDTGQARSSSPLINKKNTANVIAVSPEKLPSTSSQMTVRERGHIIDLTDGSEGPFQSLSGTSYAECRAEAQVHAAIRKDWLRKAAKAYTEKQGHVASYCADEAKKHARLMKEANSRAAAMIFMNMNSNRNDPTSVDLHGLHCDEAVEVLEEMLLQAEHHNYKFMDVVTGRGNHSKRNISRLKSSVLNYLNAHQYRYTRLNDGCFRVHVR